MRWNTLFVRILAIFTAILLAFDLTAYFVLNRLIMSQVSQRIEQETSVLAQSLDWALAPMLRNQDAASIQRLLDNVGSNASIHDIHIYDRSGKLIYARRHSQAEQNNRQTDLRAIFEEGRLQVKYRDPQDGEFVLMIPIRGQSYSSMEGSDIQAAMMLKINYNYETELFLHMRDRFFTFTVALTVVFMAALGLVLHYFIAMPLGKLRRATEEITRGNYGALTDLRGKDEFQALAETFNTMSAEIRRNIGELKHARQIAEDTAASRIQFLANMSHEIRTPLNAMLGFADLLEEDETDTGKKQKLNTIKRSGRYLLTIINDILDLSKLELNGVELESAPFSVRELMLDLHRLFIQASEAKRLRLRFEVDDNVPGYLAGDAHRIHQIITNLIGNALKFTHKGGIYITALYEAGMFRITVRDTGIGIEPAAQERIFDAFSQSDNSVTRVYGGTGLGLTVSRRLSELMGGAITLTSNPGSGSEFVVTLPLLPVEKPMGINPGKEMVLRWMVQDIEMSDLVESVLANLSQDIAEMDAQLQAGDQLALKENVHRLRGVAGNFHMDELYQPLTEMNEYLRSSAPLNDAFRMVYRDFRHTALLASDSFIGTERIAAAGPMNVGQLTILLAEDVEENRSLIRHILQDWNVRIDEAQNGAEALDKLASAAYDVLLLDMQMPVLDGVSVLKALKEMPEHDGMHIVALTANTLKGDMEKYLALGCDGFIAKPVDKDVLRARIREIQERKADSKQQPA